MKTESLISKVKYLLEKVKIKENSKSVKFSLPFESFQIKDLRSGKVYEFPEGHVATLYNPKDSSLGYPFVEEKYSHPGLPKINGEKQIIDLGQINYYIKELPVEQKIVCTLIDSVRALQYGYDMNQGRLCWYHLSAKAFEKYQIS